MTTPFPLLRLPTLALIQVFQHMELAEVIAFSFLSKRSVNLSKCFSKVFPDSIDLVVNSHDIELRIVDLTLHFYGNVSETVWLSHRDHLVEWKNAGSSTKHLIQRVLAVTKCPSLDKVILHGRPEYDVFSVLDGVPKISCLHIPHNCSNIFATQALQVLTTVTSSISLLNLPFSNREQFQRFWTGNIDCLCVHGNDLSRFQFNIDDLLASNAVRLEMSEVPMSLRDLNRFFSCWLNKTSNQRLNHLSVKSSRHFNEDVLLDGLDATPFTEERTREFRSTNTLTQLRVFTGGFDVRRIDGKLAAITFGNTFWATYINFDVWS